MNQFTPKSAFQDSEFFAFDPNSLEKRSLKSGLRSIAAQFGMHYALLHRLGPQNMKLADATYSSIFRDLHTTNYTIADLIDHKTLADLLAGNCAVRWAQDRPKRAGKPDPLDRLNIRFGVSVSFHNALGNHVALTLCDSVFSNVDLAQLGLAAMPFINAILSAERSKNTEATALSARETDCLQWAAAGKTSLETGIILGLSPHTVNQYLTEATAKLKAVNRTHAVTKAVRLGLINLSAV